MDQPFRAFTFVDRITELQPGSRIRGRYAIPSGIEGFPLSLVGEAVGQLAAWAAMAATQFEFRPVAGVAGSIELLSPVRPGQELELAAELESVDTEAVAYGGTASASGTLVLRLQNCVGPMMPVADFDDPQRVRERFALLCGGGAAPGGFGGVPDLALERTGHESGKRIRARLQVPASAVLFSDHFPRRHVFPGSLLVEANLKLAAALASELPTPADRARWTILTVSDMKLRAFVGPGESLDVEARLTELTPRSATMAVEARNEKRVVGAVRLLLALEERT
jgi:3-hydroxymyristoyl/3-hydroxydecanoyl-(acyl carrier protein) dehydratase